MGFAVSAFFFSNPSLVLARFINVKFVNLEQHFLWYCKYSLKVEGRSVDWIFSIIFDAVDVFSAISRCSASSVN